MNEEKTNTQTDLLQGITTSNVDETTPPKNVHNVQKVPSWSCDIKGHAVNTSARAVTTWNRPRDNILAMFITYGH